MDFILSGVMKGISIIGISMFALVACPSCTKGKVNDKPVKIDTTKTGTTSATIIGSFVSKYVRFTEGEAYTGKQSTTWSDTAWVGDRIHNQIVLWSSKSYSKLTYTVSNLMSGSKSIPASAIRLRFENYITGDQTAKSCGEQMTRSPVQIADALSSTAITSLTSSDPIKIWVTADIPSSAATGNYTGTIKVASNGTNEQTFNVQFLIVNKTLPVATNWTYHLDIWQFPWNLLNICNNSNSTQIAPFSAQHFALIRPFYTMLADAGQSSITTYIKDGAFLPGQTMIQWKRNADSTWNFDYTNFDKYVDTLMSWGINKQIDCFSLAGWKKTTIGYLDVASNTNRLLAAPIGSAAFNSVWSTFLTSFKSHLQSKGWYSKAVLYMDEVQDSDMQPIISVIKGNSSDWKIGLSGSYASAADEAQYYDYSTILGYSRINSPRINTVSTFYTSCSQVIPNDYLTPQSNLAEMSWMSWYSSAQGLNGYLRWAYDYWTLSDPTNIEDGNNTAGDFNFVYRISNDFPSQALSSIRLELLREGIQDYTKIQILKPGLSGTNATKLNNLMAQFNSTSGSSAASLVGQGEHLLKTIASGN